MSSVRQNSGFRLARSLQGTSPQFNHKVASGDTLQPEHQIARPLLKPAFDGRARPPLEIVPVEGIAVIPEREHHMVGTGLIEVDAARCAVEFIEQLDRPRFVESLCLLRE